MIIILESIVITTGMRLTADPVGSSTSVPSRMNVNLNDSNLRVGRFGTAFDTQTVAVIPSEVFCTLNLPIGIGGAILASSTFFYTAQALANIASFDIRAQMVIKLENQ